MSKSIRDVIRFTKSRLFHGGEPVTDNVTFFCLCPICGKSVAGIQLEAKSTVNISCRWIHENRGKETCDSVMTWEDVITILTKYAKVGK